MKFDVSNFHSIFEAAKEEKVDTAAAHDETGANIDNTLGDNDLLAIFDDICPISGDVYASMKNAAADPKNLKITMVKDGTGENSKMFIEAAEFAMFCEANDMNPGEASEEIIDTYKEDIPGIENTEIHVVFPSDSVNKDILGSENFGNSVKNDWAMQLMRGCRRYGIHVNQGVDDESKKNESLSESTALENDAKDLKNIENQLHAASKRKLTDKEHDKLLDDISKLSSDNKERLKSIFKNESLNEGLLQHAQKHLSSSLGIQQQSLPDDIKAVKRFIVSTVNNYSGAEDLIELVENSSLREKNTYYFMYSCGDSGSSGRSLKKCRDYIMKYRHDIESNIKSEKGYDVSISFEYNDAYGPAKMIMDEMEYLKIVIKK